MGSEWKHEGAHELRIRQPNRTLRVSLLKGENVDEDGTCAGEQDIERRYIFEDVPGVKSLVAQINCKKACAEPLAVGPFPGVRREEDALVLEQQPLCGLRLGECCRHQAPFLHPSLCERRPNPVENGLDVLGIDLAQNSVLTLHEPSMGIAESSRLGGHGPFAQEAVSIGKAFFGLEN